MALDHADRVMRVCLMDIVPTYHVWTHTTKNWAIGSWHWSFMAQPAPFPERLISAVPAEFFLKSRMVIRGGTGLGFLTQTALGEYIRCYTLKTITGSCHDFRASPTSDFAIDAADKDRQIAMPALVLWGARGQPPERTGEFAEVWKKYAANLVDTDAMPCGPTSRRRCPTTSTSASSGFSRHSAIAPVGGIDDKLSGVAFSRASGSAGIDRKRFCGGGDEQEHHILRRRNLEWSG
jgi:hypothetical protein